MALQRVANELDENSASPESDHLAFWGECIAATVLMALAMEIALKAWQCRERNGEYDRSHDLLELFNGLGKKTQSQLEAKMPDLPDPWLGPKAPLARKGLKKTLSYNRKAFECWRYIHESRFESFESSQFKVALSAVIEAYVENRFG